MIEAAASGVPIISGKHIQNFRRSAGFFIERDGMRLVSGPKELYNELNDIFSDPRRGAEAGARNLEVFREKKEILIRTIKEATAPV